MRNQYYVCLLSCVLSVLGGAALLAPRPAEAAKPPKKPKPASVVITPSAATLHPGESVTFTAVAFDKAGNAMPEVPVTIRSATSRVARVEAGVATAMNVGKANITAKAGGKSVKAVVTVLAPGGDVVTASLKQVNHILAADGWVYWTEADGKLTRVRKMQRTGGAIYDLAAEPYRTKTGITVSYVHLQQSSDRIYFSRQEKGFVYHWSIRSVLKAGGDLTEIIPNDTSVEPVLSNGWRVTGDRVVVALKHPNRIGLGDNVRVAVYDGGTWTGILSGQFDAGETHLIAADNQYAYVRGYSLETRITQIVKVSLTNSEAAQTLLTREAPEDDRAIAGATDGTNLYYWSGKDDDHRLLSLSVNGGQPTVLSSGGFGYGLTLDNGNLYWAKGGANLVRMPITGGDTTSLRNKIYGTAAIGGIAIDDTSVYAAIVASRTEIRIVTAPK
jgi:hypothetical protein